MPPKKRLASAVAGVVAQRAKRVRAVTATAKPATPSKTVPVKAKAAATPTPTKAAAGKAAATPPKKTAAKAAAAATPPKKPAAGLGSDGLVRCWPIDPSSDSPMLKYHDAEWGFPMTTDEALFKQLVLQSAQSGLSWTTILKKSDTYRARFENWDLHNVAKWTSKEVEAAMNDAGIVRNRLKVESAVNNATVAAAMGKGGFARFVWKHCGHLPTAERLLQKPTPDGSHMRSNTKEDHTEADGVHPTVGITAAAKAFKEAGFRFFGPTTCISFAQAAGLVNHHKPSCFRFKQCEEAYAKVIKGGNF